MAKRRFYIPIGLPIAAVILLVAGLVLRPVIQSIPEETLIKNTILNGIPFILIFVAILLGYMIVIWGVASLLNNHIERQLYKLIETLLIAGIILGILGLLQPWWFAGYRIGFHVLLFSTLGYIFWSHIIPRNMRQQAELTNVSANGISATDVGENYP